MCGMACPRGSNTSDVATAINGLLHLEEGDQAALLDVIQDYFTMPGSRSYDRDNDSDSESESEADEENAAGENV